MDLLAEQVTACIARLAHQAATVGGVLGYHPQPVPDAGTAQTCFDLRRLEVLLLRFLDYLGKQMYLLICRRSH